MTVKKNHNASEYYFEEGCYITEFWNDNADPAVSIAQARLPPGEQTKPHALKATVERYFILSGEGIVNIGSNAAQEVAISDVVLIPADTSQCIKNTGTTDLVFLAICSPRFKPENYYTTEAVTGPL